MTVASFCRPAQHLARGPALIAVSIAVVIGLFATLFAPAAAADDRAAFNTRVETWDRAIEQIVQRLDSGRTGTLEERQLRSRLQSITAAAQSAGDDAKSQAEQVQKLLATLGPKPDKASGAGETETVRKRRGALEADVALFEGRVKQTSLIVAKARQTLAGIEARSRQRLKARLFEHTMTPLNYKAWAIALPEALGLAEVTGVETPKQWLQELRADAGEQAILLRNLLIALVAALAGWAGGRWLRRHFGRVQGIEAPSYTRRIFAGLIEGSGRSAAPILFVVLTGTTLLDAGFIDGPMSAVIRALGRGLVLLFLGHALINAALTPRRHQWRLLNFGEDASRLLVRRLKVTLWVFLIFDGAHASVSWASASAELESVAALIFTLALTPLLMSLLSHRIWEHALGDKDTASAPRLRALTSLALIALPIIAAIGFPGMATYLTRSMVMTGLTLATLALLRAVGREALGAALDPRFRIGRSLRETLAIKDDGASMTLFWLRIILDCCLFAIAGLALLPVWGFSAAETVGSASNLLNGVQIGSYTLSMIDIFIGLILFALIISMTRIVQRGLERHLLPNLSSDKGVRDALKTGVGYIGFVIGGLVAISALGLDLTNLALIAGALSVGLGFGLQNVVNNFVSGLILLVERPIKPGDWVVIGGHEGNVKKVNVRSTEIETFQRASVIIPNADLIATPVINWTHKNVLGRAEVSVGVTYGTDPKRVEQILLDCAKAHPNVISYPEPFVLFMDFGDSALIFELRAFLGDVQQRLRTASQLRFAINDALIAAGIEIPFPQRVVHLPGRQPAPLPADPTAEDQGGKT